MPIDLRKVCDSHSASFLDLCSLFIFGPPGGSPWKKVHGEAVRLRHGKPKPQLDDGKNHGEEMKMLCIFETHVWLVWVALFPSWLTENWLTVEHIFYNHYCHDIITFAESTNEISQDWASHDHSSKPSRNANRSLAKRCKSVERSTPKTVTQGDASSFVCELSTQPVLFDQGNMRFGGAMKIQLGCWAFIFTTLLAHKKPGKPKLCRLCDVAYRVETC